MFDNNNTMPCTWASIYIRTPNPPTPPPPHTHTRLSHGPHPPSLRIYAIGSQIGYLKIRTFQVQIDLILMANSTTALFSSRYFIVLFSGSQSSLDTGTNLVGGSTCHKANIPLQRSSSSIQDACQ